MGDTCGVGDAGGGGGDDGCGDRGTGGGGDGDGTGDIGTGGGVGGGGGDSDLPNSPLLDTVTS